MNKLIRQNSLINFYLLKCMNILKIKKYIRLDNQRIQYQGFIKKKHAP